MPKHVTKNYNTSEFGLYVHKIEVLNVEFNEWNNLKNHIILLIAAK